MLVKVFLSLISWYVTTKWTIFCSVCYRWTLRVWANILCVTLSSQLLDWQLAGRKINSLHQVAMMVWWRFGNDQVLEVLVNVSSLLLDIIFLYMPLVCLVASHKTEQNSSSVVLYYTFTFTCNWGMDEPFLLESWLLAYSVMSRKEWCEMIYLKSIVVS